MSIHPRWNRRTTLVCLVLLMVGIVGWRWYQVQFGWRLRAVLDGHSGAVHWLAFSPDGCMLVSASDDGTVRVWDVATAKEVQTFKLNSIVFAEFSQKGEALVIVDNGKVLTAKIWDTRSWQLRFSIDLNELTMGTLPPYNRLAVVGFKDGTLKLWDLATGNERILSKSEGASVAGLVFSPDDKLLAIASEDGTVTLRDVPAFQLQATLMGPVKDLVSMEFSQDGKTLVTSSESDDSVRLWDVGTGEEILTLDHGYCYYLAFSPDGKTLVTSDGETVKIWDFPGIQERVTLEDGERFFFETPFSPDSSLIATERNTPDFWFTQHAPWLTDLPILSKLFEQDYTCDFLIWDVATGQLRTIFRETNFCLFSPDGKTCATAHDDGTVKLWDMPASR